MLKDFRKRKGLSIEELAQASGIKAKRLARFESRESSPFLDELSMLARGMQIQTPTLLRKIQISSSKGLQRMFAARLRETGVKLMTVLFAALALFVCAGSVHAETPPSKFLTDLSAQERYWWLDGALLTTAHVLAMQDKATGDCASKWYLSDKDGKQKLITATIAKYPNESPTTIILTLLGQACGPLTAKRAANR